MIFCLEIDGELKNCLVDEPYRLQLEAWNEVRRLVPRNGRAWECATMQLKSIASACVAAGAYQEKQ